MGKVQKVMSKNNENGDKSIYMNENNQATISWEVMASGIDK